MWDLKACRCCLNTDGKLEKINEDTKRIYSVTTGLGITKGDGYPNYLCMECITQMKKIVTFRRRSRRAFFALHAIMIAKKQITITEIKKIDRKKNSLDSRYNYWKPHNVGLYSNTMSDDPHYTKDKKIKKSDCKRINYDILNKDNNFNVKIETNEVQIKKAKNQTTDSKTEDLVKYTPDFISEYTCIMTDIKPTYKERERLEEDSLLVEEIIEKVIEHQSSQDSPINNDDTPLDEINVYSNDTIKDLNEAKKEVDSREQRDIKEKVIEEVFNKDSPINNEDASVDERNRYSNNTIKDLNEAKRDIDSKEQRDMINADETITNKSIELKNKESPVQSKADLENKSDGINKSKLIFINDIQSNIQKLVVPAENNKDYLILDNKRNLPTAAVKRKLSNDKILVGEKIKINFNQDGRHFIIKPHTKLRTEVKVTKSGIPLEDSKDLVNREQDRQQVNKLSLLTDDNEIIIRPEESKIIADEGHDCQRTRNKKLKLGTDADTNLQENEEMVGDRQGCPDFKELELDVKIIETVMPLEESREMVGENQDCQQAKGLKRGTDASVKETDVNLAETEEIVCEKQDCQQIKKFKLGIDANVEETSVNLEEVRDIVNQKQDFQQDVVNLNETVKAPKTLQVNDFYKCNFCQVKLQSANSYVNHILYNHTGKPYCCGLCSCRYRHKFECKDHILKIHAPECPYRCMFCGKRFAHHDFLKVHSMLTHGIDLEDELFNTDHMNGKLYVYPHMKIDMRWISEGILEKIDLEVCDYLDKNFRPVEDYRNYVIFENKEILIQQKIKPQKAEETRKNEIKSKEIIIENDLRLLMSEESQNDFNYFEITDEKDEEDVFGQNLKGNHKQNNDETERNISNIEIMNDKTIISTHNQFFISGDHKNNLDRVAKTNEELENMFEEHFNEKEPNEIENYEESEVNRNKKTVPKETIIKNYDRLLINKYIHSNSYQPRELQNKNKETIISECMKVSNKYNDKETKNTQNKMEIVGDDAIKINIDPIRIKGDDINFCERIDDKTEESIVEMHLEKNNDEKETEISEGASIKSNAQLLINRKNLYHNMVMNKRNCENILEVHSKLDDVESKTDYDDEISKSNNKMEFMSEETVIKNSYQFYKKREEINTRLLNHDEPVDTRNEENIFEYNLNEETGENGNKMQVVSEETGIKKDDRIESRMNIIYHFDENSTNEINISDGYLKPDNKKNKNKEETERNENERKVVYKETIIKNDGRINCESKNNLHHVRKNNTVEMNIFKGHLKADNKQNENSGETKSSRNKRKVVYKQTMTKNDRISLNGNSSIKMDHDTDILQETKANKLEEHFKADRYGQSGKIKYHIEETKTSGILEETMIKNDARLLINEGSNEKYVNANNEHNEEDYGVEIEENSKEIVRKETVRINYGRILIHVDRMNNLECDEEKHEKDNPNILKIQRKVGEQNYNKDKNDEQTERNSTKIDIVSEQTISKNEERKFIYGYSKINLGQIEETDKKYKENIFEEQLEMENKQGNKDNDKAEANEINIKIGSDDIIVENFDRLLINLEGKNSSDSAKETAVKAEDNLPKEPKETDNNDHQKDYDMKITGAETFITDNLQRLIIGKSMNNLNHVKIIERNQIVNILNERLKEEYGVNYIAYDTKTGDYIKDEKENDDRETDNTDETTSEEDGNEEAEDTIDEISLQEDNSAIEDDSDRDSNDKVVEAKFENGDNENDSNEETDEKDEKNTSEEENSEPDNDNDEQTSEIVEETTCVEHINAFDEEIDENIEENTSNKADEQNEDRVDAPVQEFSDGAIFVKVNGVNYEVIEKDGEQCVTIDGVLYRIEHTE